MVELQQGRVCPAACAAGLFSNAEASKSSPPIKKPVKKESKFKGDHCESRFEAHLKHIFKKHIVNKYKEIQEFQHLHYEEKKLLIP